MKKWNERSKKEKILIGTGITITTIAVAYGIYYLGKKIGVKLGSETKIKELSESLNSATKQGYDLGFEAGYTSVGSTMDIENRYSFKVGTRQGLEEGVDVGRRLTLNGLSNPDLSNPDQIKLAIENGVILTKVGKSKAAKLVKKAIPKEEFENFLKNNIIDSYK